MENSHTDLGNKNCTPTHSMIVFVINLYPDFDGDIRFTLVVSERSPEVGETACCKIFPHFGVSEIRGKGTGNRGTVKWRIQPRNGGRGDDTSGKSRAAIDNR